MATQDNKIKQSIRAVLYKYSQELYYKTDGIDERDIDTVTDDIESTITAMLTSAFEAGTEAVQYHELHGYSTTQSAEQYLETIK
jgi:hypothetical protein